MKRLYFIFLLFMLASCQTDDPLEEPITGRVTASNQDTQEAQGRVIQFASAQNVGAVTIGKELINSFEVENMRDALMSLKWRRPVNPSDGRFPIISAELVQFSAYDIQTTHQYIKISPTALEELELIAEDTTLVLSPVPLHHEVTGTGTLPHEPADFDPQTGVTMIKGSLTPQYAIIPVFKVLKDIDYEVLENLYIPTEIDEVFAGLATSRSFPKPWPTC